jgi:hypothetical protein
VVTATIASHGLRVGDTFVVAGTTDSPDFNGTFTVSTVANGGGSFTYADARANDAGNAGASAYWVSFAGTSQTLSGSPSAITVSRSGTTVTATYTAHGLSTNDRVRISAVSAAALNGEFGITVVDANSFTYSTVSSGAVGSTSGTGQKLARDVASFTATDPGGRAVVTMTLATAMPDSEFAVFAAAGDSTASFDFYTPNAFINSASLVTINFNEIGGEVDLPEQVSLRWVS